MSVISLCQADACAIIASRRAEMRAAAATKDRDAMKARLETVDGDLSGRLADAERRVLGEKERAGRAERQNTKLQGALDAAQRDVKRLRAHAALCDYC